MVENNYFAEKWKINGEKLMVSSKNSYICFEIKKNSYVAELVDEPGVIQVVMGVRWVNRRLGVINQVKPLTAKVKDVNESESP